MAGMLRDHSRGDTQGSPTCSVHFTFVQLEAVKWLGCSLHGMLTTIEPTPASTKWCHRFLASYKYIIDGLLGNGVVQYGRGQAAPWTHTLRECRNGHHLEQEEDLAGARVGIKLLAGQCQGAEGVEGQLRILVEAPHILQRLLIDGLLVPLHHNLKGHMPNLPCVGIPVPIILYKNPR